MRGNIWLGIIRIMLGWIFLWAFVDKVFGLGFATEAEKAWLAGGSPTFGFLKFGTQGPLVGIFQSMAGNPLVDWLFMLGLLGVGLSLTLGILNRLATWSGVALLVLMYLAVLPAEHNPIIDDHIVYLSVLILLNGMQASRILGFGNKWAVYTKGRKWLN